MNYQITVISGSLTAKHIQIAECIKTDIETGRLNIGVQLPSINQFSKSHIVARDTVEKAYNNLKKAGYIVGVPGKGNYVAKGYQKKLKILMILNKLSSYKKEVYEAFIKAVGENTKVDLQIHHYSIGLFSDIIEESEGKYHYYVVMPHFSQQTPTDAYINVLNNIPSDRLVILDREIKLANNVVNVFQDFKRDILEALTIEKKVLQKYKNVTLVFNRLTHHPVEIIEGVQAFCDATNKKLQVVSDTNQISLEKATVYITLTDDELAELVRNIRNTKLRLGIDVGILSFNETILKELLGITVVSTNFSAMGRLAAEMILTKKIDHIRNEFTFIKRTSL